MPRKKLLCLVCGEPRGRKSGWWEISNAETGARALMHTECGTRRPGGLDPLHDAVGLPRWPRDADAEAEERVNAAMDVEYGLRDHLAHAAP